MLADSPEVSSNTYRRINPNPAKTRNAATAFMRHVAGEVPLMRLRKATSMAANDPNTVGSCGVIVFNG